MALSSQSRNSGHIIALALLFGAAALVSTFFIGDESNAQTFLQVPPSQVESLSRRQVLAAAFASAASAAFIQQEAALAADAAPWAGTYADPNHPGCKREISVGGDGVSLKIAGADGNPGCLDASVAMKEFELTASLSAPDAMEVKIDFSPKGGPAGVPGKWDADGILFPDGNKWKKASVVATPASWAGKYADPNHPGCKREISVGGDGVSLKIAGADGDPGCADASAPMKEFELAASLSAPDATELKIDFTPKGGPAGVPGKWDSDGILFPDGNKWKKL